MPKSEKHNDPTKKKRKGKKSEEDFPAKREIVEPDIRKTKHLRRSARSDVPPPFISKILEEQSSTRPDVERKKSKISGFRIQHLRHKSGTSSGTSLELSESDSSDRIKPGFLKKKKSELSQLSSRESFVPPSSKSSFSVEIENELLFPSINRQAILEEFPTSSSMDQNDYDLLHATFLRDLSLVKTAIERGANVNVVKDKVTPLIIATEYADLRLINYFLRTRNVNINYQDHHGQSALMIAIRNGLDKIAEELIYRGANVNLRDNFGRTALHAALFHGKINLAKLLLVYGANYEMADCFGDRPMYTCAVKRPNLEGLNLLLENGAVPDYAHVTGINLLSRAIFFSTDYGVIEKLIKSGADVNHQDVYSGKTPMHFAAAINDLRITKLLLEHGANPNIETNYGYTPYDQAIFHGSLEVAQFLAEITTNDVRWNLLRDLKDKKQSE